MKFLFSMLATALAFSSLAQSQERFLFEEEYHDFGVFEEGKQAVFTYTFKNIGTDTIVLTDESVRPGCGCTKGKFTTTPILPGDTGSITTLFNTAGRPGANSKSVSVSYKNSFKTLFFKIYVIPADTAKPVLAKQKKKSKTSKMVIHTDRFELGAIPRNKSVPVIIPFKNEGKDSLRIDKILAACQCVKHTITMKNKAGVAVPVKAIPAGQQGFIELQYTPNFTGKGYDIVTLFSNDPLRRRASIRLQAEILNQ
ncbi:MAG: DUF1573 domain-containing protein [Cytophagaceae bacterium]|jgi:hypothetical protein|nr:DUF1573 domain-containing protein [Cytophagaceae bacterium]